MLRVDPNDEAIYYNMGRAYLEANMKKEAISSFKNALAIDPDFKECKEILISELQVASRKLQVKKLES